MNVRLCYAPKLIFFLLIDVCEGDNNGLGGYVDVGCIRYGFYPNNVKGADRDQGKFWAVYPDICG